MNTHRPEGLPAWCAEARGFSWLAHEIEHHLLPWSRAGFRHRKLLQVASLAMAAVVTVVWGLAANGQVRGNLVIAWWLAWSVMEIGVRLAAKPYVKEGPWWGRHYRGAGMMDMICYVSFKNLLIGAVLFLALKSLGLLSV
ncbi:MAG: transcription regulator [Bacteroidota bacterium]